MTDPSQKEQMSDLTIVLLIVRMFFCCFLAHFRFCRCPLRSIAIFMLFALCNFSIASSSFDISPIKLAPLPAEFFGPIGRRPSKHSFRRHHRMKVPKDFWLFEDSSERREMCSTFAGRRLNSMVQNALVGLLLDKETVEMPTDSVIPRLTALPLRMATNDPIQIAATPSMNNNNNNNNNNQCHGMDGTKSELGGHFGEIMPGMPIELRSLCSFMYVENVDEKRLPKRFTEVKCICDRPNRSSETEGMRCEPLQFEVPVLMFDEKCEQFRHTLQRITLACLTVWPTAATSQFNAQMGRMGRTDFVIV